MAEIISLVLPFFGLILAGYIAARVTGKPESQMGWLNLFIVYVALPALFFRLISRTPVEQLTRFDFVAVSLAATYSVFLLVFLIARTLRRRPTGEAAMHGLAAAYGNIGYMGPGLALLALGEKAAVPVALIFCFENAVHFMVAPALLSQGEGQGVGRRLLTILSRILLHPFILATLAGVAAAISGFQPPLALQRLIDSLALAAAPCALFAMGVTLALRPLGRVPVELGWIVPAKLILHPALVFLLMSAVGTFDPLWVQAAVLLAALPTATNVFVIGMQARVFAQEASAAILLTTVLSVATLTGLLYAMAAGLLT